MQLKIREVGDDTVISTMGSHRVADKEQLKIKHDSLPDDYDDIIFVDPGEYRDISCDREGIIQAIKLGIDIAGGVNGCVHYFDKGQVIRFW